MNAIFLIAFFSKMEILVCLGCTCTLFFKIRGICLTYCRTSRSRAGKVSPGVARHVAQEHGTVHRRLWARSSRG